MMDGATSLIGPNAVIQLAGALEALEGGTARLRIFGAAGVAHYLDHPPKTMIAESEVRALHLCLRAELGERHAASASWLAGYRTADYLLAHRIPRQVQRLLKLLPAPVAGRLLMAAIAAHAWTFIGSGRLSYRGIRPLTFEIADSPLSRETRAEAPCCTYYAATFERLFAVLVSTRCRVTEVACSAAGAPACRFVIAF